MRRVHGDDPRDAVHAREEMIKHNMRLVLSIAARFRGRTFDLEFEDIVQEGVVGLNRAIDKFDPERGFKFSTYATWWIRQVIQRAIANQGRAIRAPLHVDERRQRARRYVSEHPEATDEEVAEHLGIDVTQLRQALDAATVVRSLDFETSVGDDGGGTTLGDTIADDNAPDPARALEEATRFDPLRTALAELDDVRRQALELRFGFHGKPLSIQQVAEAMDKPGYVVSKLIKEGISKLRSTADVWYSDE